MLRHHTAHMGAERGFAMVTVMAVLAVSGLFIAGAFAAADGDIPILRKSQDRKASYAAAEAGVNYYLFHLNRDSDYWARCTNVPAPNATEPSPVNQRWNGSGSDPRAWRTIPGGSEQYTIELLPATGYDACVEGERKSMMNQATGTFRIRATGRSRDATRSIIATFRRSNFLDYLYFTDYETLDPIAYPTPADQRRAARECQKYRAQRTSFCTEMRFVAEDQVNGPFHTNDDILTCGSPTFGRGENDRLEVSTPGSGYTAVCDPVAPTFRGSFRAGVTQLAMPPTNTQLKAQAAPAYTYTGATTIRLNGNTMDVTTGGVTTYGVALPADGVIYVKTGRCGTSNPPIATNYNDPPGCANLFISGTYSRSLTIASEGDIIIKPPAGSSNGDIIGTDDALLGLVANNFVRVYHRVTNSSSSNCANSPSTVEDPQMRDVRIDAAIPRCSTRSSSTTTPAARSWAR